MNCIFNISVSTSSLDFFPWFPYVSFANYYLHLHPGVYMLMIRWLWHYIIMTCFYILCLHWFTFPFMKTYYLDIGDLSRFWRSCLGSLVYLFSKAENVFGFPTFPTWYRVFQKRVVRGNLDIYVLIFVIPPSAS